MERRLFLGACAAALALLPSPQARSEGPPGHPRALLVDENGRPVAAGALEVNVTYIFHYPYFGTPCFLIRLPQVQPAATAATLPDGWPGGVGPGGRIVAYGAICTHLLTHPTREIAMIHYYPPDEPSELAERGGVITCCAHGSVFDPAAGGRVVAGPAPAPLPAIELEHDERTDRLTAVGVRGAFDYRHYLKVFKRELRKTYGRRRYKSKVGSFTELLPLDAFTAEVLAC